METRRGVKPVSNRVVGPAPATVGAGRMPPVSLNACYSRIAELRRVKPSDRKRYAARPRGPPLSPR